MVLLSTFFFHFDLCCEYYTLNTYHHFEGWKTPLFSQIFDNLFIVRVYIDCLEKNDAFYVFSCMSIISTFEYKSHPVIPKVTSEICVGHSMLFEFLFLFVFSSVILLKRWTRGWGCGSRLRKVIPKVTSEICLGHSVLFKGIAWKFLESHSWSFQGQAWK